MQKNTSFFSRNPEMGLCASAEAITNQKGDDNEKNKVAPVAAEMRVKAAIHIKRRVDIFNSGFDPTVQFTAPTHQKNEKARGMISDCLKNHFLFSSLTDDDRDMVITAFAPEKFSEGAEIISQGEKHAGKSNFNLFLCFFACIQCKITI